MRVRWGCAAGVSIVALLAGLCMARRLRGPPRSASTLTSPRTPTRSSSATRHGRGDIVVAGRGTGLRRAASRCAGAAGAWSTVPRRTDGTLLRRACRPGRRPEDRRLRGRPARPRSSPARRYVGVGDIYIVAGQSNASRRQRHPVHVLEPDAARRRCSATTTAGGICATRRIPRAGRWISVSADAAAGGSVWPLVATALMAAEHVPVAFVPCARAGRRSPRGSGAAAAPVSAATLYGSMVRRIAAVGGRVRAVLFWQGEADARRGDAGRRIRGRSAAARRRTSAMTSAAGRGGADRRLLRARGATAASVDGDPTGPAGRLGSSMASSPGPCCTTSTSGTSVHFVDTSRHRHLAARRWAASILGACSGAPWRVRRG